MPITKQEADKMKSLVAKKLELSLELKKVTESYQSIEKELDLYIESLQPQAK